MDISITNEERILQLEIKRTKMDCHLADLQRIQEYTIKKYEQIIIDSMEISTKLHLKCLDLENNVKQLDTRLDRELDNYLDKISLLEHKIEEMETAMDFQHKACEIRYAISIHPEPDKLIDELKDKVYYQSEEE